MIALIFSCQINKRDRLAPASALRSSTSAAAAAAALSGPGWKPPAGPGLHRRGRVQNSLQGGGRPGLLGILEVQNPLPEPDPPLQAQFTSAPAAQFSTHARPTRDSYPAHPRKSTLSVLLNLDDLRGAAYAPLHLKHKDMAKRERHRRARKIIWIVTCSRVPAMKRRPQGN